MKLLLAREQRRFSSSLACPQTLHTPLCWLLGPSVLKTSSWRADNQDAASTSFCKGTCPIWWRRWPVKEEHLTVWWESRHPASLVFAHSFTRNRTRGSDFLPFLRASEVPTIFPRSCMYAFWIAGKDCSSSLDGYDFSWSRAFWGWRSACVTGRTTSASDLLGRIWATGARSERVLQLVGRWRASLPPFTDSNQAVWREDNGYASPSLTYLSGPAHAAQASGSTLPAGVPSPENTSAGFVCGMDGLHSQICHCAAQSWEAGSGDHSTSPSASVPSRGAAGPLYGLESDTLRVCQTAPTVPTQPGSLAGRTGAFAAHGRRTSSVARHESFHGRALLAYPTQTPFTWPVYDHSQYAVQDPDSSAYLFHMPTRCATG